MITIKSDSLKLLNTNKEIVAEIFHDRIIFYNQDLKNELNLSGISIPYFLADQFDGKRVVKASDKLFVKAFVEVECKIWLRESGFFLVDSQGHRGSI